MNNVGSYLRSALHGFSSFWRRSFKDVDVLETLQRGSDLLHAESYANGLRLAQAAALKDATPHMLQAWVPFDITPRLLVRLENEGVFGYFFATGRQLVKIQYLQDKILSPTVVLESGLDFEPLFSEAYGWGIWFSSNPIKSLENLVVTRAAASTLLAAGMAARCNHGVPDAHIVSVGAARALEINARERERRTLRLSGEVFYTLNAAAYGTRDTYLDLNSADLPALIVGAVVNLGAPFNVARSIKRVAAPGVVELDAPVSGLAAGTGTFAASVVRPDILTAGDIGAEVEIYTAGAGYTFTYRRVIVEVLDALTAVLNSSVVPNYDVGSKLRSVTVDTSLSTITYAAGESAASHRDIGSWIYLDCGTPETSGYVEVVGVGPLDTHGYAPVVAYANPDGADLQDGSADATMYPRRLDRVGVSWSIKAPEAENTLTLWAPDVVTRGSLITNMYGVLVGRTDDESTDAYKDLIQGIFRYYQLGPTRAALLTALNVMAGIPVAQADGETFIRVEEVTDGTVVVTDLARYLIPSGTLREDLARMNPGSYVFEAMEPFTDVFAVEDESSNPMWYKGVRLPVDMMPGQSDSTRTISTDLRALRLDGSWSLGDPAVALGGSRYRESDTVTVAEAFVDGTTAYAQDPVFWPEDVGKKVYVNNRPTQVASFTTRYEVELVDSFEGVFDAYSRAFAQALGSAITISNASAQPYGFSAGDVGRLFYYEAGSRLVRASSWLTSRTMLFEELDGSALAEAITDSYLFRTAELTLIRAEPVFYGPAFVAARLYAGANLFGVRYDLRSVASSVTRLQRDIRDIILDGKLSGTNMLDLPGVSFEDDVLVSDSAGFDLAIGSPGGIGPYGHLERSVTSSAAIDISDLPTWTIGDFFQLSIGSLEWVSRITPGTSLPVAAAPVSEDRTLPGVVDSRSSSVIWLDLRGYGAGQTYEVSVYAWDGAAFTYAGIDFTFDTDAPAPQSAAVPPALLYFEVNLVGPGTVDFALQVGVEAQEPYVITNGGSQPTYVGSIALGDAVLTVPGGLYIMDESRDLYLTYDDGLGATVREYVRIAEVLSPTEARLVYLDTAVAFSAAHTASDVAVYFGPQRAWGQTAITLGIAQPILTRETPTGVAMGAPFALELPLQLGLQD